jgi:cyclic pyranopterin monophosphate synthase
VSTSENTRSGAAPGLTHVDASGAAHMVNVSDKPDTERRAVAAGEIRMSPDTLELIRTNSLGKGDVLAVARIAGIMAAKRTSDLIPLCHPLPLTDIKVELVLDDALPGVRASVEVRTTWKTGVEMEALTGASVALLTVYDMAKATDRAMTLGALRVTHKFGGRSGSWSAD